MGHDHDHDSTTDHTHDETWTGDKLRTDDDAVVNTNATTTYNDTTLDSSGTAVENEEGGGEALGAGAGALAGAGVGMAVGGPPGAVVGGAIGAVGGAVAGEAAEGDDEAGSGAGGLAGGVAGAAVGGAIGGPPGAVIGGAVGAAGGAGVGDQAEEEAEETDTTTTRTNYYRTDRKGSYLSTIRQRPRPVFVCAARGSRGRGAPLRSVSGSLGSGSPRTAAHSGRGTLAHPAAHRASGASSGAGRSGAWPTVRSPRVRGGEGAARRSARRTPGVQAGRAWRRRVAAPNVLGECPPCERSSRTSLYPRSTRACSTADIPARDAWG